MGMLKVSLKGHADTRWGSRANATEALHSQIAEVTKALKNVAVASKYPEAVSTANSLLKKINYNFLCTLSIWCNILTHIERVNEALQAKGITVSQACKMINRLQNILQEMHESDNDMVNIFTDCKKNG
ncbi:hypothetical protein KIL84_002806 [Mauremys mutica]|uniref:Uncharacterized protein n=1 Tax=Mauremys mutica TaxID=74926 RepID=A0A9D4AQK8_9SAUR|nr:hypothetical protein KIL84_002806 [Mauremys mutica]